MRQGTDEDGAGYRYDFRYQRHCYLRLAPSDERGCFGSRDKDGFTLYFLSDPKAFKRMREK